MSESEELKGESNAMNNALGIGGVEARLRAAGCKCDEPLIDAPIGLAPRCRLCNVVAATSMPCCMDIPGSGRRADDGPCSICPEASTLEKNARIAELERVLDRSAEVLERTAGLLYLLGGISYTYGVNPKNGHQEAMDAAKSARAALSQHREPRK